MNHIFLDYRKQSLNFLLSHRRSRSHVRGESYAVRKKRRKIVDGEKKTVDLGRGKGGAALLSPSLGSLLPSRFTPFFASSPPPLQTLVIG